MNWGPIVLIAIVVIIVLWAVKRPSEGELESQKREKEHEIEMTELESQRQEAVRRANIPSGRGKIVKARRN